MKKSKKKVSKIKVKELAQQLQQDLDVKYPIHVLPNGNVVYKDFVVKESKQGHWAVYNYKSQSLVGQFFLKSCALMAAKAYYHIQIEKFYEIKRLDSGYWASYTDAQVFRHNIKKAHEFERYLILLNRLEDAESKEKFYKEEISRMFKWSFV